MTSLEAENSWLRQQMAYYKGKCESYESMLKKAKMIESDKEKLIRFDPIMKEKKK